MGLRGCASLLLVVVLAGACSSSPEDPGGEAACAASLTYAGQVYYSWSLDEHVARGPQLGAAAYPGGCDDEPDSEEDEFPSVPTTVWRMPGVDPDIAVIGWKQGTKRLAVYAHPDAELQDLLPGEPHRVRTARCGVAPTRFAGARWNVPAARQHKASTVNSPTFTGSGTMTRVSEHYAQYLDEDGTRVPFVPVEARRSRCW